MQDDIDFKQAMSGVRRLNKESVHPGSSRTPSRRELRDQIRQRARDSVTDREQAPPPGVSHLYNDTDSASGEGSLLFTRSGVQKKTLRDLKKGSRYPVDLTLDLHGFTQTQAQSSIDRAMAGLPAGKLCNLLIIHGKGLRSREGARLKSFTAAYLKTLPGVRAYCSAQQRDGGTGAVYVLVRGQV